MQWSHLRAVLLEVLCIATVFNLCSLSVFKVTMPTVDPHKCIFGSSVWAVRRRRECFPWSGFPEMTENATGFVWEDNSLFWGGFNV